MAELDARRSEVLGRSASIIQRKVRSYLGRKSFILLCRSAIQIQAACRGQLARQVYESMRREASCLRIQRDLRMYLARKAYKDLCSSAICIQTGMRGMAARSDLRFRRHTRVAIIIQSQCRKNLALSHYMELKKAAITTQCAWRRKVARKELKNLKMCDPYFDATGCSHPGCEPAYPTPKCVKKCVDKNQFWRDSKHYSVSAYRIHSDPHNIMAEVYMNGPVEVAFTVYEDFAQQVRNLQTHHR